MTLKPMAFAVSGGIIWGVAVFLMALVSGGTGYGLGFIYALGTIYLGVQPGILGAILGLVYGFIDFFIFGFIFVTLYNILEVKCEARTGK